MPLRSILVLLLATSAFDPRTADCADSERPTYVIVAENGRFNPSEIVVPPGTAFLVHVKNGESSPIEFESFELHRERVVEPGETISVNMPSLTSGDYKFFDDFHQSTPQGTITVK